MTKRSVLDIMGSQDNIKKIFCRLTEMKVKDNTSNTFLRYPSPDSYWKGIRLLFIEKHENGYRLAHNYYDQLDVKVEDSGIAFNVIYEMMDGFSSAFSYKYFTIDEETKTINEISEDIVKNFREL